LALLFFPHPHFLGPLLGDASELVRRLVVGGPVQTSSFSQIIGGTIPVIVLVVKVVVRLEVASNESDLSKFDIGAKRRKDKA
jgi:hypothetical protein